MSRGARSRVRRLGRRAGLAVFAALVSLPTLVWSLQIMRAVWFPPRGASPATCPSGLSALLQAVERARTAARLEQDGERASLARFREAVGPVWASRPALDGLCTTPRDRERLREVNGLRYAEEHAVRYEATTLAHQRRRAHELSRELARENERRDR